MATSEELVEALREALYEEGYVQPFGPVRGSDYLTADTPESERPAAIAALRAADAEVERANDACMERVIASIAPIIRADERERIAQEIEADCDHMSSGVYEDASLNDVCPVCARCAAVARGGESDG